MLIITNALTSVASKKGKYDDTVGSSLIPFAAPDETLPVANPNVNDGHWYFKKQVGDPANKKFNYYFFADLAPPAGPVPEPLYEESFTFGELTSVWAVVYLYAPLTDNAPYLTIYTKTTNANVHWYDWRVNYVLSVPTIPLVGKVFLWAGNSGDPGVHPEVQARLQLTKVLTAHRGTFVNTGGPSASDEMLRISIQTASNQPAPVELAVEGVGYTTTAVEDDGEPVEGDMELVFSSGKGKGAKRRLM